MIEQKIDLAHFKNIKLWQIMCEDVINIDLDTPASHAAKLMRQNRIHGLCLTEPDNPKKIKNVITSFDLLNITYLTSLIEDTQHLKEIKVKDIVQSQKLITLSPQDTVKDALEIIAKKNIRTIPITEDGMMVGIVSVLDIVKAVQKSI